MKKKILFVTTNLNSGGAERSLLNLLKEIDYDKYSIDLLLLQMKGIFLSEIPKEVNLLNTPNDIKILYGDVKIKNIKDIKYFFIRLFGTIYSKLKYKHPMKCKQYRWNRFFSLNIKNIPIKYDCAIAFLDGEPLYLVEEKISANKKIGWVHNEYDAYDIDEELKKFDKMYFSKFDKIVTISDICLKSLKNNFAEIKDKFIVIPNITSSKIIREKSESFYPSEYTNKTKNILSIGRLTEQKAFERVVYVGELMKKNKIDFKWYIIGDGYEKNKLNLLIKKYGLKDNVKLIGTKENPYPYIKNSDIIVQTSKFEGKSIVLDEAKILAKPIVSTKYNSVVDQVINEKEGLVVEQDVVSIYNGIYRMINDRVLYNTIEEFLKGNDYGNEHNIKLFYDIIK